jgi:hypothetical protein
MPFCLVIFAAIFAAAARLIFRLRHFDFADTPPLFAIIFIRAVLPPLMSYAMTALMMSAMAVAASACCRAAEPLRIAAVRA